MRACLRDTIAAIATPPGSSGIAIIRVSGKEAFPLVSLLVGKELLSQPSHTISLKTVTSLEKYRIDQTLLLVMRAPKSFTGEDVVEIHCHGGALIAKRILHELTQVGVRPANPGEFSERAFLNGKIDLAQAEAIQDLIGAKNEEALRIAGEQLEGKLSTKIKEFQTQATSLAAIFEAWVDFPEEDLGFCTFDQALSDLKSLEKNVNALLQSFHSGKIIHSGFTLCILGAPNVGKSSLMNALLGKERAIVTPIAGTTRDIVEDDFQLKNLHCKLIDTAGIRHTTDIIEHEGVRRSKEAMGRADIILAVLDASRPHDMSMLEPLQEIPKEKSIFLWNKIDLASTRPLPQFGHTHVLEVSATTQEGLFSLQEMIEQLVLHGSLPPKDEIILTNVRHKASLEKAHKALKNVIAGIESSIYPEFIALEMREVLYCFGEIIGTNITEDILNAIFSKFCIGK